MPQHSRELILAVAEAIYERERPRMHFPTEYAEAPEPLRATYEVMAAASLTATDEANMLRPFPWPAIPYPEDAVHQARWTIQRAHSHAKFYQGSHDDGHIAAAQALIAEGWTPPTSATAPIQEQS